VQKQVPTKNSSQAKERSAIIIREYTSGKSVDEIAKKLNVSNTCVYNWLNKSNIPLHENQNKNATKRAITPSKTKTKSNNLEKKVVQKVVKNDVVNKQDAAKKLFEIKQDIDKIKSNKRFDEIAEKTLLHILNLKSKNDFNETDANQKENINTLLKSITK
jgi:transposase